MSVDREKFEQWSREAFESLPATLMERLENVVVVVEDEPSAEVSRRLAGKGGMLLGLYEGVPLTGRGPYYGTYPVAPDKISLFFLNILRSVRSEKQVPGKIRDVLIHEIAHHFGMDEDEIRDAGY